MKTSTVLLSSIIAAGATGVQARPFFGNPVDLALDGLLGRRDLDSTLNKVDDHTAHGPKASIDLTGDSKVELSDTGKAEVSTADKAAVKVSTGDDLCLEVLTNGALTRDCKVSKGKAADETRKEVGKVKTVTQQNGLLVSGRPFNAFADAC